MAYPKVPNTEDFFPGVKGKLSGRGWLIVHVGDGPLPPPNGGPEKAGNCDFELAQKRSKAHSE